MSSEKTIGEKIQDAMRATAEADRPSEKVVKEARAEYSLKWEAAQKLQGRAYRDEIDKAQDAHDKAVYNYYPMTFRI